MFNTWKHSTHQTQLFVHDKSDFQGLKRSKAQQKYMICFEEKEAPKAGDKSMGESRGPQCARCV